MNHLNEFFLQVGNLQILEMIILFFLSMAVTYFTVGETKGDNIFLGLMQTVIILGLYYFTIYGSENTLFQEFMAIKEVGSSEFINNFWIYLLIVLIISPFVIVDISIFTTFIIFTIINIHMFQCNVNGYWVFALFSFLALSSRIGHLFFGGNPGLKD